MARHLSRRELFNRLAVPILATAFVAACGGQEAPAPAGLGRAQASRRPSRPSAKPDANATPVYSGVTGTVVPSAKPAADAAKAKGTMRYLYNATPGPNEKVHLDLIDLNSKLYPDVTVEKIRVPDDAEGTRKLLAMIAANDVPDLFWNRQRTATPFIARGALLDLKPMVAADKIDLNDFWPSAIKTLQSRRGPVRPAELLQLQRLLLQRRSLQGGRRPAAHRDGQEGPLELGRPDRAGDQADQGRRPHQAVRHRSRPQHLQRRHVHLAGRRQALGRRPQRVLPRTAPRPSRRSSSWSISPRSTRRCRPAPRPAPPAPAAPPTCSPAGAPPSRWPAASSWTPCSSRTSRSAWSSPRRARRRTPPVATIWPPASSRTPRTPRLPGATPRCGPLTTARRSSWTSRRSFTARRSFLNSEDDEDSSCCRGKTSETYKLGLERTGVYVAPNHTGEVNAIFDRELNLAYLGEKSVKDAADTMKKEIDVVLKKPL